MKKLKLELEIDPKRPKYGFVSICDAEKRIGFTYFGMHWKKLPTLFILYTAIFNIPGNFYKEKKLTEFLHKD